MLTDYVLDQGAWLVQNVQDVQSHGGVCHAMTTEWVFAKLQNNPWNVETEYWRGVSHQRAYSILWQDALRGLWGGGQYNQYLQVALRPTRRFVEDPARRQGLPFQQIQENGLNRTRPHVIALGPGCGLVIVMFGVDVNQPPDAQNWGHTVAMARLGNGTYLFLDLNQGQFHWPLATPALVVASEVQHSLEVLYGGWGIRDVYLFRVG